MKRFKRNAIVMFCAGCLLALSAPALADLSHYSPGGLGIKNATCPPPGFWYAGYNQFYTAGTDKDNNGNTSDTTDMDVTVFANVNPFNWMTGKKILGADYGVNLFVPLFYTDVTVKAMGATVADDNRFGLGDISLDPVVLSWYGKRWDGFFAAGFYIPTGDHDHAASPEKGYWSFVYQDGATCYFDEQKSWSFAARGRFLHSTEDTGTDITPGSEAIFEYGLGKEIPCKAEINWPSVRSDTPITSLRKTAARGQAI